MWAPSHLNVGLCIGSCAQHASMTIASAGGVLAGIAGRSPFCTTPTAACICEGRVYLGACWWASQATTASCPCMVLEHVGSSQTTMLPLLPATQSTLFTLGFSHVVLTHLQRRHVTVWHSACEQLPDDNAKRKHVRFRVVGFVLDYLGKEAAAGGVGGLQGCRAVEGRVG